MEPFPQTKTYVIHFIQAKSSSSSKGSLYIAGEDCPAPVQGQYIFSLKKGQVGSFSFGVLVLLYQLDL